MANTGQKTAGDIRRRKPSFWESQRLAKQRALERQAKRKQIGLGHLSIFTEQLASMLDAGLPLVTCLEALMEQTENPHFRIIIRDVRTDVSGGTAFSEACAKFPNCFPNLFISMVEAGEASGNLAEILKKTASYFEDSVKLTKKIKSALAYPIAVILLAVGLVAVLLVFVIPEFAEMFGAFGEDLPRPTQILISISEFLQSYILLILPAIAGAFILIKKWLRTPVGCRVRDNIVFRLPLIGKLSQKIALSRFCRTYAILMRSGVPILQSLEITGAANDNTFIKKSVRELQRAINQGGQLSDVLANDTYFPPMVRHMVRAGEQTGNVDSMLLKVSDFYDVEIDNTVSALTSLLEPALICFLGIVIGSIVMAMFAPIFGMSEVVGG